MKSNFQNFQYETKILLNNLGSKYCDGRSDKTKDPIHRSFMVGDIVDGLCSINSNHCWRSGITVDKGFYNFFFKIRIFRKIRKKNDEI